MEKTAVKWLVEQIENNVHHTIRIPREFFEQAKDMEKQQMINFSKKCLDKALDLDVKTAYSQVQNYYKETFNK